MSIVRELVVLIDPMEQACLWLDDEVYEAILTKQQDALKADRAQVLEFLDRLRPWSLQPETSGPDHRTALLGLSEQQAN